MDVSFDSMVIIAERNNQNKLHFLCALEHSDCKSIILDASLSALSSCLEESAIFGAFKLRMNLSPP